MLTLFSTVLNMLMLMFSFVSFFHDIRILIIYESNLFLQVTKGQVRREIQRTFFTSLHLTFGGSMWHLRIHSLNCMGFFFVCLFVCIFIFISSKMVVQLRQSNSICFVSQCIWFKRDSIVQLKFEFPEQKIDLDLLNSN